ncbi:hypothetical protein D3C76_1620780 [compost metagenome]
MRNPCAKSAILSDTLPEREQKVGTIFVLEQKVDFINKNKRILASGAILRNPIQDVVEYDQHADGKKLLAQVENIVANQPIVNVDVGRLGERIQTAGSK